MNDFAGLLLALDWKTMAVPALSVLEKILRPLLIYVFLALALRIAGKRELAQLNTLDFVVLLLLSNTVQNAIIGNDNSVSGGIIGAVTLLAANYLVVKFLFRHPGLEALFEGRPDLLIIDGVLNKPRLAKELITVGELEEAARKQGIESLSEVAKAEIDNDGAIIFVAKRSSADRQHAELLAALDGLRAEIKDLRSIVETGK